ncbi:hypothetical protein JCM3765_001375 [Sporobolomyces pararoseus]
MSARSLEPRPYRSIRPLNSTSSLTRPLSVGSNLSGVSSSSSITGQRRRRSAALLERELGSNPLEDTPGRRSIRLSLTRAEEVLRASERQRELERRKERVGLRAQQLGRSTRLLEHFDLDDTTEELDNRPSGPERLLRKARSIPSELLMSPTHGKRSNSLISKNVAAQQRQLLSRPASSAAIIFEIPSRPVAVSQEPSQPPDEYLSPPVAEPTSKFSASSTDSIVHVARPGDKPLRFKDRARSFNQSSTNGIKTFGNKFKSRTPSKSNLRKKPSLAGIFRDPPILGREKEEGPALGQDSKAVSRKSSRFRNLGHQHNTSVSSSAPSTDRDSSKQRESSSRLGFFRSGLRDSTNTSSSGSRPRSAGTISPSIISAPLSVSSGGVAQGSSDKRFSSSTESSTRSGTSKEKGGAKKLGWVSRLGRTIRGKNVAYQREIFEEDKENEEARGPVVQVAEKVRVGSPSPRARNIRPPSRVPITSLFGREKTNVDSTKPPLRPLRPSSGLVSSDDTTFYGNRVENSQIQLNLLASTARKVRAKSNLPIGKTRAPEPNLEARPVHTSTRVEPRPIGPFSDLVLLPPARIETSRTTTTRKLTLDVFEKEIANQQPLPRPLSLHSTSRVSSHSDHSQPSPARSFRSPSPARFRDLIPSGTASSPDKNERGLPKRAAREGGGSPKSVDSRGSPRRRAALGPEQIICMTDARERTGPISQVRGATTDLADLLSGLEETQDYDRSRSFTLPGTPPRSTTVPEVPPLPSPRRHELPHFESIESLRSTVSDVPEDLKDLINAVDDHISEVETPSLIIDGYGMRDRGFSDEGFQSFSSSESDDGDGSSQDDDFVPPFDSGSRFLSVSDQHTTNGFTSSDGATSTMGFDSTVSSFEGHVSTAAGVLRGMLEGPLPRLSTGPALSELCDLNGEETETETESETEEEGDEQASLPDSVREALDVGRPSAGDRMFERFDSEVSLSALVDPSPAPVPSRSSIFAASFSLGHFRHETFVSSSDESTGFSLVPSSPTPNLHSSRPVRHSLARYSQDRHPYRRPSHRARPHSQQFSSGSSERKPPSSDYTNSSSIPSSHSTKLSIASITSSPCPVPRNRRIPMLTSTKPPLKPSFRFPAANCVKLTPQMEDDAGLTQTTLSRDDNDSLNLESREDFPVDEQNSISYSPEEHRLLDNNARYRPLSHADFGLTDTPPSLSPQPATSNVRSIQKEHQSVAPSAPFSNLISCTIVEENEDLAASPLRNLGLQLQLQQSSPSLHLYRSSYSRFSDREDDSRFYNEARSDEEDDGDVLDSEDDYDFTARDPEVTRKYVHLTYEAETEIKRSQAIWPDTDRSREAVALFDAPKTYHSILDFLFSSQTRFPSPPHLARLSSFVPIAFADPLTPLSPVSPISPVSPVRIPSPLRDSTRDYLASAPPPPEAQPSTHGIAVGKSSAQPPLRKVLGNKSVNVLSSSTSAPPKENDGLSPFTALPPRIGSKLRGSQAVNVSPAKKKKVDVSFLGDAASRRRQAQFNAAARRLEGTGLPSEQRSDDETDDTGVLEAKGEATDNFTFTK